MSSGQRKRPGGAVDSRPARKRSRLLPSRAGGTSQTEATDLEQSGTPAFEPGVIEVAGGSSQPEVIVIHDDESAVGSSDWHTPLQLAFTDREQSQQQPHLFRASESSAEPLARDDEEEPREDDGDWLLWDFDPPYWSDEDSEDREQNQQQIHLSQSAENSAWPLTTRDEEEPRDNDGSINSSEWPDRFESPPTWQDDITEDWEGSQQYSLGSRSAENWLEAVASNLQQEPRDIEFYPPRGLVSSPDWEDDRAQDWEGSQQYSLGSRSAENWLEAVASNLQQEPRDIEFYPPRGLVSSPDWEDDSAQFLEVHEQERRNVTLNSQEQVDGSSNETGANDAPVADSAPAEQGAEEVDTPSSDAEAGVVIRCPICLNFYSEIMQSGQQLVATLCGHVFCSECLPVALDTAPMCPTCREQLNPDEYLPIYL